ncbi:MAG: histidine--tRNA ligase [Proteobacteria bacterium]|nr:histidine--tRNA ligase [Pseudomonadota bacterium]
MSNGFVHAVRGMNDVFGDQSWWFDRLELVARNLLAAYGYTHVRLPVVEKTELFCRSIGEVTDIVEKEMYTFADRNGDSLTLRPEGTAGCVRAAIENSWLAAGAQKVYYLGPMFRHERPQKGRYRQFYQFGVETFGMAGPDIDAELIMITARLWKQLGIEAKLLINSLGSANDRSAYREALTQYFSAHYDLLDEDSQKRLHKNPLRILDSKNPELQALIQQAPQLADWLDDHSKQQFAGLLAQLDAVGIPYQVTPTLVRGLDYYNDTVFEWVTTELGAQGTICAGGRYDGLVTQLGGKATPAIGFAMGMERVVALMQLAHAQQTPGIQVYVIASGEQAQQKILALTEQWRDEVPNVGMMVHHGGGSFKSQFKKADKSGAHIALILGDDEVTRQTIGVKFLRNDQEQITLNWAEVPAWLRCQITND